MGTRGRAACGGGRRPPLPRFGVKVPSVGPGPVHRTGPRPPRGRPDVRPARSVSPAELRRAGVSRRVAQGGERRGRPARSGRGPDQERCIARWGERLGKRSAHTHARASGRREGNDRRRAAPGKSSGGRPRRDPAGEETRPPALSCPEASCRARPCDRAGEPVMILPQVHLRKPCYDFSFL